MQKLTVSEPFFLAQLFPDILDEEQVFVAKHLNVIRKKYSYPISRRFHAELAESACALLIGFRLAHGDFQLLVDLIDLQVDHPKRKSWDFGVPYYDNTWEDAAVEYGILEQLEDER